MREKWKCLAVKIWPDELKIVHSDDPDPHQAGLGMVCFPLMKRALANGKDMLWWWMSPAEQAAIFFILDQLRPKIAIEIGTLFGGSLQVLSKYSDQVYSIDIDPEVPKVIGNLFANVRYLTGNSDYLLPPLIDDLQQNGAELAFALVDGDHSANGVRKDINHLLRFRPTVPFYILMHDSHTAAAPPSSAMKSRRFTRSPRRHARARLSGFPGPAP
jgi:cephalosporin hydroxylase